MLNLLRSDAAIALAVIGGVLAWVFGCVALGHDPASVLLNLLAGGLFATLAIALPLYLIAWLIRR